MMCAKPTATGKPGRKRTQPLVCIAKDCTAPAKARSYCTTHYWRSYRYGQCQAVWGCNEPAISHIGLCPAHHPRELVTI